jgi:hypothetical protein
MDIAVAILNVIDRQGLSHLDGLTLTLAEAA